MEIPSFVDLKRYLEPEERRALVMLIDAALGKSTAQIQSLDGIVREGWLNIRMPQNVAASLEKLAGKLK